METLVLSPPLSALSPRVAEDGNQAGGFPLDVASHVVDNQVAKPDGAPAAHQHAIGRAARVATACSRLDPAPTLWVL